MSEGGLGTATAERPPFTPPDVNKPDEVLTFATETQQAALKQRNMWWDEWVGGEREAALAKGEKDRYENVAQWAGILTELTQGGNNTPLSPEAADFVARGGSAIDLLKLLSEHAVRETPSIHAVTDVDKDLIAARRKYMTLVHKKGRLFSRDRDLKAQRDEAEKEYVKTILLKLDDIATTQPVPQKSLPVGFTHQIIEKFSFGPDLKDSLDTLAASHLHVLMDVLLREQVMRDRLTTELSNSRARKIVGAVSKNKFLRAAVAGSLFATTALGATKHQLPPRFQPIANIADHGLEYLSAYFTSRWTMEGLVGGGTDLLEKRRHKKNREALAGDKNLADLALQTTYGVVEADNEITARRATEDGKENMAKFKDIERTLREETVNGPGGEKPYTGESVLQFCEQLYLKHRGRVDAIVQVDNPHEAYYGLASILLTEELTRMRDQLSRNRLRKGVYRGVSAIVAVVANQLVNTVDEAKYKFVTSPKNKVKNTLRELDNVSV